MQGLLPDTTLSHYRIVSKIAEGGMGEVYLAEDTRLNRKVALKLLSAELSDHKDRLRRFEQEAQLPNLKMIARSSVFYYLRHTPQRRTLCRFAASPGPQAVTLECGDSSPPFVFR